MQIYEQKIQKNHARVLEILYGFEKERKKYNTKKLIFEISAIVFLIVGIIPISTYVVSCFRGYNSNTIPFIETGVFFFGIIACMLLDMRTSSTKKNFKNNLKNKVFKELLTAYGNIRWVENTSNEDLQQGNIGLDNEILERSALFACYNRRKIDDEFKGNYNGVNFKISETHMEHVSGSGRSRTVVNIFQGVIVQFDSNKKVLNRTMIATKRDHKTAKITIWTVIFVFLVQCSSIFLDFLKTGVRPLSFIVFMFFVVIGTLIFYFNKKEEPLNKVTLEDPEFNKRFDIYSSDQVEARYLVTPSFMERLNNLTTAFGCNKVKCSFFDDNFMVAISTKKDLFEIGRIDKPLTNPDILETFYKELNSIYDMIDYFKLGEKTRL